MPGDARGSVCVAAICWYTSLVCSVVQEYGAAARHRRSKWRHDSAPMNQNSTAAHRPAAPLTTAPDTALWPPDYPDEILAVTPPVIPAMKIRHLNPRQMVSIPEQRVTVRHPVLKASPGKMWHTAELVNRPPADQPPRQITLHLQPPVGLTQPGQSTGVAVDQRHNLTLHFCPAASPPATYKIASGSPEISRRSACSPSGVLTTKPHDSAGEHRRACARIADSVCVIKSDC